MNEKVVVVTGGGRGIGRAICRRFAATGAHTIAAARTEEQLNETQSLIQRDGGSCSTCVTDVADRQQVAALMAFAEREHGRLDVLINNAGVALNAPIEDCDPEVFDALDAVNIRGVFHACRAAWPMLRRGGEGVIVNISSVAACDPFPGFAAYGASKAFVEALTRGLATEGKEAGIRVYCVGPGAVDTQMLRGPFPDFPAEQCLQPDDIAETVYQMTQPACRYAVGQTLYVNK